MCSFPHLLATRARASCAGNRAINRRCRAAGHDLVILETPWNRAGAAASLPSGRWALHVMTPEFARIPAEKIDSVPSRT